MSEFHVTVYRVEEVLEHPDAELSHLSVVKAKGYTFIAGKMEDGSYRYNVVDLVVGILNNTIIPENELQFQGFYWDDTKNRGMLKGSKRNRVGAVTRGSVTSDGILFPVETLPIEIEFPVEDKILEGARAPGIKNSSGKTKLVLEGDHVEDFYGMTEYKP